MEGGIEDGRQRLTRILLAAPWHAAALRTVREVCGEAAWIGAGFVRNAVWDELHGRAPEPPEDVDVLIHDPGKGAAHEIAIEAQLSARSPDTPWSVRNQARMHERHGDAPYPGLAAAMRRWPETATAVAVRLEVRADGGEELWILAPFGLDDLLAGILRPASDGAACRAAFDDRLKRKRWQARWPGLVLMD